MNFVPLTSSPRSSAARFVPAVNPVETTIFLIVSQPWSATTVENGAPFTP